MEWSPDCLGQFGPQGEFEPADNTLHMRLTVALVSCDLIFNVFFWVLKWKCVFFQDVLWPSGGRCYHTTSEL